MVEHIRSDLSVVFEYNADYAQRNADFENTDRERNLKIGSDAKLCGILKEKIKKEKYSPYAVIAEFNLKGWPTEVRFCEKTLYNLINKGIIQEVTSADLPNKGIKYKEKGSKKRYSRIECAKRSIEYSPKEIESREEFGYWEPDTVKGGKDVAQDCLFTMTERKTRKEKAVKMANAKAESTVSYLNKLEKEMGSEKFRKTFKTLTCDGGSEFMDIKMIKNSYIDRKPRTKVFFAHPFTARDEKPRTLLCSAHQYSACEKGTNENHNRMLRRFFPKSYDFSKVTENKVKIAAS